MGPLCSPQPGTCRLIWHPPPEFREVACGPEWPPLKLQGQLERQVLQPDLQDWRLQVPSIPVVVGRWWCWKQGKAFLGEVEMGEGGSVQ